MVDKVNKDNSTINTKTVYVNSEWAELYQEGDEISKGVYYGINAFSDIAKATAAVDSNGTIQFVGDADLGVGAENYAHISDKNVNFAGSTTIVAENTKDPSWIRVGKKGDGTLTIKSGADLEIVNQISSGINVSGKFVYKDADGNVTNDAYSGVLNVEKNADLTLNTLIVRGTANIKGNVDALRIDVVTDGLKPADIENGCELVEAEEAVLNITDGAKVVATRYNNNEINGKSYLDIAANSTVNVIKNSTLDVSQLINDGTLTIADSTFIAGTVTNNGDFTVKGSSYLAIDNITGAITLNNATLRDGSTISTGSALVLTGKEANFEGNVTVNAAVYAAADKKGTVLPQAHADATRINIKSGAVVKFGSADYYAYQGGFNLGVSDSLDIAKNATLTVTGGTIYLKGKTTVQKGAVLNIEQTGFNNSGNITVKGTVNVYSNAQTGNLTYSKLAGDDNNNSGIMTIDGGTINIATKAFGVSGGYASYWKDNANASQLLITNKGKIVSNAKYFINGTGGTITIQNNSSMIFQTENPVEGSVYDSGMNYNNTKNSNLGVINVLSGSTLDLRGNLNDFTNSGAITVNNATLAAGTITNEGDFTVKGKSKLDISNLSGSIKIADAVLLDGTSVIGATASDLVYFEGKKVDITGKVYIGATADVYATVNIKSGAEFIADKQIFWTNNAGASIHVARGAYAEFKGWNSNAANLPTSTIAGEVHVTGNSWLRNVSVSGSLDIDGALYVYSNKSFDITGTLSVGKASPVSMNIGHPDADTTQPQYGQGDYAGNITVNVNGGVLKINAADGDKPTSDPELSLSSKGILNITNNGFANVQAMINNRGQINITKGTLNAYYKISNMGTIIVNSSTLDVALGDKLGTITNDGTITISGKSTVNAKVNGNAVTLAKNTVLTGNLEAVITVSGTASLTAGSAFKGTITSGTLKVAASNVLTITGSSDATLLVAAGDYSEDTFGAAAIKGATRKAEITLNAAALNGNTITNAKVNFNGIAAVDDSIEIKADVTVSDIKSINDFAVKSIDGVYFYNDADDNAYILNKVDGGVDIVEATSEGLFTKDMGNFNLTGNLSELTVTMKSGNTTVKVANGEKTAIGTIDKDDQGGVNNVTVGNGSHVEIGTIERMGKITVGKNDAGVTIGNANGTSAAETISIGNGSTFNSGNLDFATGKATFKLGKDTKANIGDYIVYGSSNTITLGANAEMTTGRIINYCGNNYDAVSGTVKYAPAAGTTISLAKGADMKSSDVIGLAGLTLAGGSAEKRNKKGVVTAKEVNTTFTAENVYGTEKNNTINIGNYGIFSADSINLFSGNDTVKIAQAGTVKIGAIDFGAGKDTLSIGKNSKVELSSIAGLETLNASKGATIWVNNGAEDFDDLDGVKGTWKNAALYDMQGELEDADSSDEAWIAEISGSTYGNEWDLYTFKVTGNTNDEISLIGADSNDVVMLYKNENGTWSKVGMLSPATIPEAQPLAAGMYAVAVNVAGADMDKRTADDDNSYAFQLQLA